MMRTLWLSGECANRCGFCDSSFRFGVRMKKGARELEVMEPTAPGEPLLIRGVEPALRPDILELIALAKARGFSVCLQTNGRPFADPARAASFAAAGISFRVYLFSALAATHDAIAGSAGSHRESLLGLANLSAAGASVELEMFYGNGCSSSASELVALAREAAPARVLLRYIGSGLVPTPLTSFDFFEHAAEELRDALRSLRDAEIEVSYDSELIDLDRTFDRAVPPPVSFAKSFAKGTPEENRVRARARFDADDMVSDAKPLKLYLELTRNCNLRCIMCRVPEIYDPAQDMDFDLFRRVADELFPYAGYVDLRGWGESTILRRWDEFLDYALQFDTQFGLVTNLTVENDEMWAKMARHDFAICASIDGATKATFEGIRRRADFGAVVRNLSLLSSLYREHGSDLAKLSMFMAVQRDNLHEVPDVVRLAADSGIERVRYFPVHGPEELSVSLHPKEEIRARLEEALQLGQQHGIQVDIVGSFVPELEQPKSLALKERCDHPWTVLYVTPQGTVGPCNHLIQPPARLGTIAPNHGSIAEAWNAFGFRLFRTMIHGPNRLAACDWCFQHRYAD